jgi:hypothetical protein
MEKGKRRALVVSVVIFVTALGRLTTTGALTNIRSVDALLLFAVGMSAGVVFVQLLQMRKSKEA